MEKEIDGVVHSKIIDTTLGRLIFNSKIPQSLGYVDRTDPDKLLDLEIDFVCTSKKLKDIVDRCIRCHGFPTAAAVLDDIKALGYKYSTRSGISISVYDMTIPPEKAPILRAAEESVLEVNRLYQEEGLLSDEERYKQVISIWEKATEDVTEKLLAGFDRYNAINMIATSGARGSTKQMRQLAGMRGLMFATSGKTIEIPIKSNFREGLTMFRLCARRNRFWVGHDFRERP